jgi:hypothetical protein
VTCYGTRFEGANPCEPHRKKSPLEPYAPIPGAGPFAASMDLFTALVTDLQDPAAGRLTACEVEELLAVRGREVLRQMVQDHLDLRAVREQEAARERGGAVMGADRITRSRVETGHHRLLATLFGTVRVTRCAWRRPGAGNLYPADAASRCHRRRTAGSPLPGRRSDRLPARRLPSGPSLLATVIVPAPHPGRCLATQPQRRRPRRIIPPGQPPGLAAIPAAGLTAGHALS